VGTIPEKKKKTKNQKISQLIPLKEFQKAAICENSLCWHCPHLIDLFILVFVTLLF
jgi:hypothetical protein